MLEYPYPETNRERRCCDPTTFSLGDTKCLGWPCLMEDERGLDLLNRRAGLARRLL